MGYLDDKLKAAGKAISSPEGRAVIGSSLGGPVGAAAGYLSSKEGRQSAQKTLDSITGKTAARHKQQEVDRKAAETKASLDADKAAFSSKYANVGALKPAGTIEDVQAPGWSAQAQAAQLTPAERIAAQNLQRADLTGAQINAVPQEQLRAQQMQFVNALQQQAAGQGPSLAQAQLKAGTDRALQQQLALAASQGGGLAGQRMAARNIAGLQQESAGQAAMLRAQEQLAAQQMLGGQLAGVRGQDIGLATAQGQLGLGAAQLTAGENLAQAQLGQQAALANQQAANQFALQQGQMQQATNLANAGYQQQAALANQQGNIAQVSADLQAQGQADAMQRALMAAESGFISGEYGLVNQQAGIQAQADAAAAAQQGQQNAAGIGAIGAIGAKIISDENLKENIAEVDSDTLKEFMGALKGYDYNYKDSKHGQGSFTGPMAQGMEKSRVGREMVMNTPEGKMIDTQKAFVGALASLSNLNERLSALEEKK